MPSSRSKPWKGVADENLPRSFPFRLADLPPEIRILIFTEYLKWMIQRDTENARRYNMDKGLKTPELIKALRPDAKMYTEALDVYFDLSAFSISSNSEARFRYMSRQTLERAQSLEIWYGFKINNRAWKLELTPCFPVNLLFRCTNVHRICLTTTTTTLPGNEWPTALRNLVKQTIVQLPRLQILTLVVPRPRADERHGSDSRMKERIKWLTTSTDHLIGIEHSQSRRKFTWDAGKRRTLTWTDKEYWRSIPWKSVGHSYTNLTLFHNLCFFAPLNLHFMGLNPRPCFFSCADEKCSCTRPGQDWRLIPPVGGVGGWYESVVESRVRDITF